MLSDLIRIQTMMVFREHKQVRNNNELWELKALTICKINGQDNEKNSNSTTSIEGGQ